MCYKPIFFLDIIIVSSMEQEKSEYLSIMREVSSVKEKLNESLILIQDQFRENMMTTSDIKEDLHSIKVSIDDILLRLDFIECKLESDENEF